MQRKEKRVLLKTTCLFKKGEKEDIRAKALGLNKTSFEFPAVDLEFLGSHCFVCVEEPHCLQDGCQEERKPCMQIRLRQLRPSFTAGLLWLGFYIAGSSDGLALCSTPAM